MSKDAPTDAELRKLCKSLGMPVFMFDTQECRDALRKFATRLSACSATPSADAARLDAMQAWTKGDISLMPPGHHGGKPDEWLVCFDDASNYDRFGSLSPEYKATTLREAIDAAIAAMAAKDQS